MGDTADYYLERHLDFDEPEDALLDDLENGVWTQRDGTRIKVVDITDSHLLNAHRYLKRIGISPDISAWLEVFETEMKQRNLTESEND